MHLGISILLAHTAEEMEKVDFKDQLFKFSRNFTCIFHKRNWRIKCEVFRQQLYNDLTIPLSFLTISSYSTPSLTIGVVRSSYSNCQVFIMIHNNHKWYLDMGRCSTRNLTSPYQCLLQVYVFMLQILSLLQIQLISFLNFSIMILQVKIKRISFKHETFFRVRYSRSSSHSLWRCGSPYWLHTSPCLSPCTSSPSSAPMNG